MSIKIALKHITSYRYERLIQLGPQTIRLKPAPHARIQLESYSLSILPKKHFLNWQQDPFGNHIARAVFPDKTKLFKVEVDLVADMQVYNPFDFFIEETSTQFPFSYEHELAEALKTYLDIKESGNLLVEFVDQFKVKDDSTINFLVAVNKKIKENLHYILRYEPGVQSCKETLELGSGSCRDMAWLLCQVLRHCGLATRFTSGYLIQLKADVKSLDGPSGAKEDFTDLHAWTEVYIPGAGWIGLDPTSGLLAGEGHIPLCCTPNPISAAPISGILDDCDATLQHSMSITRIFEDRRITKPYRADEWQAINELGNYIDEQLINEDVRLTMGGEPTFVSLDDRDGSEWKYAATSAKKEALAKALLLTLKDKFAPNGLIHYGQGKWCPGEILPRWSYNCFWRLDSEPIWQNASLLAIEDNKNELSPNVAKNFLRVLCEYLAISPDYILEAYEDVPYYLWQEHKLSSCHEEIPDADLYRQAERKRIQALFEKNLKAPVGMVLPLAYSKQHKKWFSNYWKFKNNKLILLIGDSPLGLRLPLNRLPSVADSNNEQGIEKSLFDEVDTLPLLNTIQNNVNASRETFSSHEVDNFADKPSGYIKTALCAEVRENQLYVFLPPLFRIEHFLELIVAIEATAKRLELPIRLEGYGPPKDIRMQYLSITPDPGVIEVNIQPSKSWPELVNTINTLYEEAQKTRLSTQKFTLDGKCIGTEGGNHIVVGGATPTDSPFLRRPHLLSSMLTFWQNHPSLSYLFSSTFIGPTSQSPRVDEARQDALYELEIAIKELKKHKEPPLWLVDRLFRNLLVDITGNTHRSEFCIDKLFNPNHENGRLGLLELRNFEMPPHPQMNLVQALLVRAVIALFWDKPFKQPLQRFGTLLHDKFMLPYYIWEDFKNVIHFLKCENYSFKEEWYLPFFEFRFPKYGVLSTHGLNIELRTALEPWPVLGEEIYQGSVSRSVDSAVERLQIKVDGILEPHHIIACNGRRVPLRLTEIKGTTVAGIRFKAWNPPSSLHPTIDKHAPLVFDLIDTRYSRSIAGFTYHVMHPGGRNYETMPVNENEAQGRRLSRFVVGGHSAGTIAIPAIETNQEFPYTLDLRR